VVSNWEQTKMIFRILNVILIITTLGCAPIKFSGGHRAPPREKSVFQKYLDGEINRDDVVAWFFVDESKFRMKVLLVQEELAHRNLSRTDIDRTDLVNYDINGAIDKFNDRNVLSRSGRITSSIVVKSINENNVSGQSYSEVEENGARANSISESAIGTVNSVMKNGFVIQKIDLLKKANLRSSLN
jgi:hypothetical protein